ncbi:hypothetical protein D3C80_1110430 [compost metagenome]
MLDALTARAFADGGVHRLVARRAEQVQIAAAETRDGLRVQQHLGHRRQGDGLQLARRALRLRVEGPDRFQFRSEHIEAYRLLEARGEDVDHPAAHGVFAALRHGGGAHIAVGRNVPLQGVRIEVGADLGREPRAGHGPARRRALGGGRDGGDDQQRGPVRRVARRQPGQSRHTLGRDRGRRAQPIIRQAVPGWIFKNFNIFGEEPECLDEIARALIVARDEQGQAALGLDAFGDDQGVQPLRRAAQFDVCPHRARVHQPIPLATSAATCSRMKARMRASIGPSNSGGVGSRSMIQA